MEKMKLKGKWNQLKGEIKKKWASLTDDDLTYAEGDFDQLVGRIQQRTGEKREEIRQYLNELMREDRM